MYESRFIHKGSGHRYLRWGEAGSEKPPLVLVHGFAQSAEAWNEVAPLLSPDRAVYAFELAGHGTSDRPTGPEAYSLAVQADALLAFLKMTVDAEAAASCEEAEFASVPLPQKGKAPGKPLVVGYSMGGRLALSALMRDADADAGAFGGLVLESAGLGPVSEADRSASRERDRRNAARLRESGVEAFMDEWSRLPLFATQRALSAEVRRRVRQERLSNDAEVLALTFEEAGQSAMPAREETLAALARAASLGTSVLYVAGSCDEKYRALAESLPSLLPQVEGGAQVKASAATPRPPVAVRIVSGVGHNVHMESPAAFVRELSAF